MHAIIIHELLMPKFLRPTSHDFFTTRESQTFYSISTLLMLLMRRLAVSLWLKTVFPSSFLGFRLRDLQATRCPVERPVFVLPSSRLFLQATALSCERFLLSSTSPGLGDFTALCRDDFSSASRTWPWLRWWSAAQFYFATKIFTCFLGNVPRASSASSRRRRRLAFWPPHNLSCLNCDAHPFWSFVFWQRIATYASQHD